MMKGQGVTAPIWTLLVAVIAVVVIFSILILSALNAFAGDPGGFTVSFVKSINDPYSVLEGFSSYKVQDRTVFEHMLEASVAGALKNSSSEGLPSGITSFVKEYERQIYIVSAAGLFQLTNIRGISMEEVSCGDDAFCQDNLPSLGYGIRKGPCGVGSIADPKGKCLAGQTCCKFDPDKYTELQDKYNIVNCGKGLQGICNSPISVVQAGGLLDRPYCGNGFVIIDDFNSDCKKVNNGETTVCCAFATSEVLQSSHLAEKVEVPFLYKGKTLFEPREYRCQYSTTESCIGEYVSGLCGDQEKADSNIKCCITDEIRCKQPNSGYFCRDDSHCSDGIVDNMCPDPDMPRSTYECCKSKQAYKEDNQGKAEPSGKYGSCVLWGTSYSGEPVVGRLEMTSSQ